MPIPLNLLSRSRGRLVIRRRLQKYGSAKVTLYRKYRNRLNYIGSINLVPCGKKCLEAHSWITKDTNHGKGYGIYLYSHAVDYAVKLGKSFVSSLAPSSKAKRVYKSKRLKKFYVIKKRGRRWHVRPKTR